MRVIGGQRVIAALLAMPRMRARAVIVTLPAAITAEEDKKAYRIYVCESLYAIAENTARIGGGKTMTARYADIISRKKPDTRSAREIVDYVINRAGLVRKDGE